jgi:hypothetical protein
VRDFLDNEQMLLNLQTQRKVSPGDIIIWTRSHGQFEIVNRLSALGVTPEMRSSSLKGTELYNSTTGVAVHFDEKARPDSRP